MNLETIVYYAKQIYSEQLEFIPDIKPNVQDAGKYACFKMPEEEKESEMLYIKITTLNNYFFEFLQ